MSGKTILITRPLGDEKELTDELHALGLHVIHEPLTHIFLKHTQRAVVEKALLKDPHAVVVTSKHAVAALSVLTELRDIPLVCVGEATAHTAESCGFLRISEAGGDVDKLIDYIAAAYDEGSHFVYVSAEHVRVDLQAALAPNDMSVERIVVYEAVAAEQLSDTLIAQLQRKQIDAVCFFSERSAAIFTALLEKANLAGSLQHLSAFVLSDAIADALYNQPWQAIYTAAKPSLASMVECVDNGLR